MQVVDLPVAYDLPFVVPPSQFIVYQLALSPHAFALTRICDVLARYKHAYDLLKQKGRAETLTFPGPDRYAARPGRLDTRSRTRWGDGALTPQWKMSRGDDPRWDGAATAHQSDHGH